MWYVSSCSESFRLPEWQAKNTALWQGSSRERSPVGFRFSELLFLDVPGTATEQVRTCGFRKKSSSSDKAPKMRDSVRLNSLESFWLPFLQFLQKPGRCTLQPSPDRLCFVTDCPMHFLMFHSKLPLIFSYSSLLPWFWRKSLVSCEEWIDFSFCNKIVDPLFWERRVLTKANS